MAWITAGLQHQQNVYGRPTKAQQSVFAFLFYQVKDDGRVNWTIELANMLVVMGLSMNKKAKGSVPQGPLHATAALYHV